ncbi:MAG: ATP-dependent protease ATPase subunit HslU [Candidatus Sumerlaeota bacterium]|nr:ATP-dependent protease ATPase subunit HslU [Candidatus Sumerlaeota bacterium]
MSIADTRLGRIEGPTPREIVEVLDRYIIGQAKAKRMVAIALRNRNRRKRVPEALRDEVTPKNIIMIGPTGVGKTEIARRLSRLAQSPFLKVEATKYTEVGYVGRDVESMIRDLVEIGLGMVRSEKAEEVGPKARGRAEERLLDLLLPPPRNASRDDASVADEEGLTPQQRHRRARARMRKRLDDGELNSQEVEVEIEQRGSAKIEGVIGVGGLEEMTQGLKEMLDQMMPRQKKRRKLTVAEARRALEEEEIERLLDMEKITQEALERVQQSGIIFLDEFDKIAGRGTAGHGPDVSREGVQRDILPIVEGSTVATKYGMVNTDHILFIAAGAFHDRKPADLIPELQGRFPLRVELDSLGPEEFKRILIEPDNALTKQYSALLATEGVDLVFTPDGIDEIAESAARVNQQGEDIGARRLHTVMERILEDTSFAAPDLFGQQVVIDRAFVKERLKDVIEDQDLSKFIL